MFVSNKHIQLVHVDEIVLRDTYTFWTFALQIHEEAMQGEKGMEIQHINGAKLLDSLHKMTK